jgi:Bacterial EndoU nuclease
MGAFYNPLRDTKAVGKVQPLCLPKSFPMPGGPFIDGPYFSLEHMKECSPAYNLFIEPNSEKAAIILLDKIKTNKHEVFVRYFTRDFVQRLPFILEHTCIGKEAGKGYITGLHFRTSNWRIERYVNSDHRSKIPFVVTGKMDWSLERVLRKKAATTFWPLSWDIEKCMVECAIAWNNKKQDTENSNYTGFTSEGLRVTFCFRKGELTTVYPDFSNNFY